MKKAPVLMAWAIGLTVGMYVAAYYWLPDPQDATGLIVLFAAIALVMVWAGNLVWRRRREKAGAASGDPGAGGAAKLMLVAAALLMVGMPGCSRQRQPNADVKEGVHPAPAPAADPATAPATASTELGGAEVGSRDPSGIRVPPVASPVPGKLPSRSPAGVAPATDSSMYGSVNEKPGWEASVTHKRAPVRGGAAYTRPRMPAPAALPEGGGMTAGGLLGGAGMGGGMVGGAHPGVPSSVARVTGTAFLLPGEHEGAGYGLYSYALLEHPPSESEKAQYRAFLTALLNLPTAAGEARYVPLSRINVTLIPVTGEVGSWTQVSDGVDRVLAHYDYARSAVMLASLGGHLGHGPVLVSVSSAMDPAVQPHPVLVQDLTRAQAGLMQSYVSAFVAQAGRDRFWDSSALRAFTLNLQNLLVTMASAVNLSRDAVQGWVKLLE